MDPLLLATGESGRTVDVTAEHDKALSDLREVVHYLRQENNLLDLKCETLMQDKIVYPI